MNTRRLTRNTKGPAVQLNFTAPALEVPEIDRAAQSEKLTRASFVYRAVSRETQRILNRLSRRPVAATG